MAITLAIPKYIQELYVPYLVATDIRTAGEVRQMARATHWRPCACVGADYFFPFAAASLLPTVRSSSSTAVRPTTLLLLLLLAATFAAAQSQSWQQQPSDAPRLGSAWMRRRYRTDACLAPMTRSLPWSRYLLFTLKQNKNVSFFCWPWCRSEMGVVFKWQSISKKAVLESRRL